MTREERMDMQRCKNETQRNHLRWIEEHGVSIISVASRVDDEAPGPPWTYSIGFWQQYSHPEVLIVGLDQSLSGSLINWMNRAIRDEGRRFEKGAAVDDVLDGDYVCHFQPIASEEFGDWFAADRWFYGGNDQFEAVQMIWPDLQRRYPWESAAPPRFRALQPFLGSLPKIARHGAPSVVLGGGRRRFRFGRH